MNYLIITSPSAEYMPNFNSFHVLPIRIEGSTPGDAREAYSRTRKETMQFSRVVKRWGSSLNPAVTHKPVESSS